MLRWFGYLLLLVVEISETQGSPTSAQPKVDPKLVQNVHLALEKMLDFFSQEYISINLDGLFGLRLGQGQLMSALEECEKRLCDRNLAIVLKTLVSKVEDICSKALPYVEQNDPTYYKRFEAVVARPNILPYNPTILHPTPGLHIGFNIDYDEERGDACYSRILGTFVQDNSHLPKCNFTADCMAYMTQDETARYFITHQLLYFIFIENVGCADIVIGSQLILEIETNLCQRIYYEAESYIENGDVDGVKRDLFLEQINLCGSLGFANFMKTDWIRMILGWPDWRVGCFKFNQKSVGEMADEEINSQENDRDYTLGPSEIKRRNKSSMRKLLRDTLMTDGCRSHTSGLGFGAFGVFMRYLYRNV